MKAKKIVLISLTILVLLILSLIFYSKFFKKIEFTETKEPLIEKTNEIYNSNIIKDVMYTSMDADGNQYTITALEGEIDYSNPNILYLTGVKGLIQLKDSDDINITSNFGRYNSNNFDTVSTFMSFRFIELRGLICRTQVLEFDELNRLFEPVCADPH